MFSVAAVCSPIQYGKTKSEFPIYIIKNTSFSCEELPAEYKHYNFMPLTDDDKASLLVNKAGSFVSHLMAIDIEQAKRNFKNLLITSGPIEVSFRIRLICYNLLELYCGTSDPVDFAYLVFF